MSTAAGRIMGKPTVKALRKTFREKLPTTREVSAPLPSSDRMLTDTSLSSFEDRSRSVRASVWKRQDRIMQLGFIGTGEITSSIVTGLSSSCVIAHSIWLSPRNSAIAKGLANRFHGISVASSNQEVLDHSDAIVIAVRPSAARGVLSELRFRSDHRVISLVSGLSLRSLSELVAPVPTENSIALKKREQHSRGNEFLGLRKHLSNRRVVNDPPYRLPEQRITTAGSVYTLKRKRWLKLPVVRIGGGVLPPAAVQ